MKNKQFKVLNRSSVVFHLPPPRLLRSQFCHIVHFRGVQTSQQLAHRGVLITSHMIIQRTLKWSMIVSEKNTPRWMRSNPNQGDSINHPAGDHAVEPWEVVWQNHQTSIFQRCSGQAGHARRTHFASVGGSGVLFGVSPLDLTGRW